MKLRFLFIFLFISPLVFSADEMKPYTVYIRPNTLLTKISDKSELVLTKGIYAKVLELDPKRRNQFYVYDKNGVAEYLVSAEGIVEIEEDVKLLPGLDARKVYPPKSVFKTENKSALFNSQFNIHIDRLTLSNLNEIYSDQIDNVISTRYEARSLYVTDLPLQFGLSLNYQSAYWKNDFETVKISILSFGPHFLYHFYKGEQFLAHAILGAEVAPIYQGSTANYTDTYSAMLYDLGVETEWNTPIGILSFGGHYRHHEIALSKSNRPNLAVTPKEFSLSSLGIMAGYKIEWEL
ncbi:MAG: hypothetical protein ACXVLQ_17655 [Bacteriovorax sp.]